MGYNVGIIPAAGKATRFGRIPKELLPLPDGKSLIDHAVERLSFCDKIVIVSSSMKLPFHKTILGGKVQIVIQHKRKMLGAWLTACELFWEADHYYMTMPDTYIDGNAFDGCPHDAEFALGVFETNNPERFGVLGEGGVVDKWDNAPVPATAWGVLMWSQNVYSEWITNPDIRNYTDAINSALHYGLNTWQIGNYFDCADIDKYLYLLDYLRR